MRRHAIPIVTIVAGCALSGAAFLATWMWQDGTVRSAVQLAARHGRALYPSMPAPATGAGMALPLAVLGAGLLCSALLAGYLLTVRLRTEDVRLLVEERTRELRQEIEVRQQVEEALQAASDELETLVRERTAELSSSEEALREYALRWEATFNAMGDAIAILDLDGRIRQCNHAMLDFLAKSREELVGVSCCRSMHGQWVPHRSCPYLRMRESGRRQTLAIQHAGCWLNIVVEPILDARGELAGAVHVIADISELKKAEQELIRANRALKTLSASNRALVYANDERSLLVEICRSLVEEGGFRFAWVGYAEHEEPKRLLPVAQAGYDDAYLDTVTICWHDDDLGRGPGGEAVRSGLPQITRDTATDERFAPWREEAIKRGFFSAASFPLAQEAKPFGALNIYAGETDAFNAEEVGHLQELSANLAYGIGALRTRQEHRLAEEALRESAERYRTLVENMKMGISLVDREMNIMAANSFFRKMFDTAAVEPIGKKCFTQCSERRACRDCPGRAALKSGQPASMERELLLADGSRRLLRMNAFPLPDARGKATRFMEVVEDITEQRQAEADKAQLELQLRHSQKMEALGTLAGGIAHDFNNILTAIDAYCALIGKRLAEEDPARDYLGKLVSSSQRASALTRGLLTYSRKQPLNRQPLDLGELVGKVGHLLARVVGEDIELAVLAAERPTVVLADAPQIEQVLMNLAANARDAMPEGGLLRIATAELELDGDFVRQHGYGMPGRYAQLTVSDTGCGIDPQTRERIFEPFFTTKEVGKGTGLGLSIVYGIVKQHSGYINVYSEPGGGTTFRIHLPLSETVAAVGPPPPAPAAVQGTETLLLIEDDAGIRSSMKELLEQEGYTVIEAADGRQGVDRFREHRDRVALVILDMVMPKMNGRAAYEEIDRLAPGIRSIFISGYTADILNAKGVLHQQENFLAKPISVDRLLTRIREVLDEQ